MRRLTCIVVDDEPIARQILREFIDQTPFLELKAEFENTEKADHFIKKNAIDLLFLDIEMPNITGIEYLTENRNRPAVIITTAYPKYAIDGYGLDIIDYLLKPIAFSRF